ncbi:MAG: hypothetical protein KatS3mg110_0035 [Pirellulaceae bacterium]|nr:MAG: hypothetical protein KatS3mg110_0035 [Pirellulaceae bacterium]
MARLDGDAARLTSGTLAREINYSWDIGTRLVAASDPDSSYTLAYDDLDRLVSIDNQGTPNIPRVVLNSSYDASGNRTRLAAVIDGTDDFVNDYTYDLLNRMTRVDQSCVAGGHAVAEKRVDMAYNSLGQFTQIVRYRALSGTPSDEVATSVYTYDAAHRLVGLSHNRGGQPLFTPYSWTYDPLDRIIEMVNSDGTSVFTYDQTDQLTGADHSYQTDEAYQYDANGNRTGGGYVTGSNNQLLEDSTYRYEYDAEGNRTAKETIATGEREEYTWDHRNRLVRFLRKDAQGAIILDVHYSYDVFDRRIGKTVDPDGDGPQEPSFTWFVYDNPSVVTGASDPALVGADHIVLEFTGSQPATLKYRYLHGPVVDQVFAREDVESLWQPGEVLWALGDHLGTVRDLFDSAGNVVNHLRYEAFGRITSETNAAVDFLFAFTGRERDEESGLFYYRARYYDPAAGRFISEDPVSFKANDMNLVRYVGNAPTGFVDPLGNERRRIHIVNTRTGEVREVAIPPGEDPGEFIARLYPPEHGWIIGDQAMRIGQDPRLDPYLRYEPPPSSPPVGDTSKPVGPHPGAILIQIGIGFVPGIGELQDAWTIIAPDSTFSDRLTATISLSLNVATFGRAPNFGAASKAARKAADAAQAAWAADAAADAARVAGRTYDDIIKNEEVFRCWVNRLDPVDKPLPPEVATKVWERAKKLGYDVRFDENPVR